MKKTIAILFGAMLVALSIQVAPANGATTTPPPVCVDWKLQGAAGPYPDVTFGAPGAGSAVTGDYRVKLVKPTEGVMPGTEFASYDVDLEFALPVSISVEYELNGGASHAAGAIRLFYYEAANADTIATTPTAFVAADSESGTLTISGVTKVGTLGMTYDGSNTAGGHVIFKNLKVGPHKMAFKDVCVEETPSPSPSVSTSPSATASASPSASTSTAAPAPSVSKSLVAGGGPSLPVTGAPTYLVAGVGVLLVAAGVAALVLSRRRRAEFEAE